MFDAIQNGSALKRLLRTNSPIFKGVGVWGPTRAPPYRKVYRLQTKKITMVQSKIQ